jgi:propionyl-CoA synthetase
MGALESIYRRSLEDPGGFWREAAAGLEWEHEPTLILDDSRPPFYRWFADGVLNTCHNALDRHVEGGRAEQAALVYDSPVTGTTRTYTYAELLEEVATLAGALAGLGVNKGDTVVIYMPMVPEAVFAMLACARLGAIHSVVFGGFAPHELAIRIDDARPKVVLSASCGIEVDRIIDYKPLLDRALELATHAPEHCVILQREQASAELVPKRDLDWRELTAQATPAGCVPVGATDPLYILYTSGTTGMPKGVVRDNGGHAVALRWSMEAIYDTHPGEVFWAASDLGWAVGHSYIVYAPLLTGCTSVLYEGKPVGTPDAGAFWRVIAEHDVKVLFTAPTAFRAIKKEDSEGVELRDRDLSRFRYLFLAGERLDPDTYHWATRLLGVPVIDHWWQTESGWPMAANCMGIEALPLKPGSPTRPVPGFDVRILRESGEPCEPNEEGAVAVRLPLPPGTLTTLWRADDRFVESYMTALPGHYVTGDGGHFDEDGYLFVMGRVDDVINVAGHRLSTGAIEEVLASHPDVAECAVIGVPDDLRGQVPLGLVVLKVGAGRDPDEVGAELITLVREQIGAFACYRETRVVERLPKTRSGKVLRGTMRSIAAGREYSVPSTIDDPTVLAEIEAAVKRPQQARSS